MPPKVPDMTSPVAYLTGEYPALSHTFILREVAALRAAGRDVQTCAVRRARGSGTAGPAEAEEARRTFYILRAARQPATLLAAFAQALSRPRSLGRGIRLAWTTRPPGLRALIWQGFYLIEAMVLARHLRATGIRHLHNHFANSSCTVAMLTSVLADIPFSFTLHGPAIFFEPHRWRIDEKIARASFIACISHFCRSQGMIFADPVHWPKMRIVHCGVTPALYGRDEDRAVGKNLLFVGRLAAVKGVAVLLEALATVRAAHPEVRLTLIGDGPERAALQARAKALGVTDIVTFAGAKTQDEVAEALSRTDLFVLPSFAEGVPVVLMEAMASRIAVIATRIAGIPELVEDGVSGRLVPPGDTDGLANAINVLLSDADARTAMGIAGRAIVEQDFDIATEASRIGTLIDGGESAGIRA